MKAGGSMKAYLATTGALFALVTVAHVARTVSERMRFPDPGYLLEGPGLGVLAGALCFWAVVLFRRA